MLLDEIIFGQDSDPKDIKSVEINKSLMSNIDEIEIPEKLKSGYSFENKRQYRDYLNRRFAQNVDFRKVKGSKVTKITQ